MEYLLCGLIGYAVGSINPSYIIARLRGVDIREKGSRNAGASNALIVFGKMLGIICALLDIAKAYLALRLTEALFADFPLAFSVTAVACVIGHIFPFHMKFKGGKGLACLGGLILFFDWRVFLAMLALEIFIALLTDYICFVPITASVIFPCVYAAMTRDLPGTLILLVMTALILGKHIENLIRIRCGIEMHLSYLWKPQKEIARMKANLSARGEEVDDDLTRRNNKKP